MTTEQHAQQLAVELDRFIETVVPRMEPERIIVFGSFASGDLDEWSDLDLVIIANTALPFFERLKQVLLLVRSDIGMDVLVYTPDEWEQMKKERLFIREEIVRKGKVVYERSRSVA